MFLIIASEPVSNAHASQTMDTDMDDLPQDIRDQIAAMEAQDRLNSASGSGSSTDVRSTGRTCPHCTFENSHGGSDCEVCGLPLG